ncbi:MAG: Pilus assembly protein [uncultured Sulfurovum sp.]|uniref:Pilus assembly protein n=1 Tax=uncultured Sulfurovum sp. TaxID=269237 RepID=A0A6S6SXD6_9BACT|nr:MAG: Pilus assembly protein [uncultured Sulfurovum sp.]
MKNITLVDSGPLIALFDKGDKYHQDVLAFFKEYQGQFVTTWAVVTEVTHMLDFNLNVQLDFLKWLELGAVEIYDIKQNDLSEIIPMMTKYTNVPMDLADSTLMFVAHKENIKDIISIDSDFDIYRTLKQGFLNNLLRG